MEPKSTDRRIEEREYARQEERRGRRHAYETLEPARAALVVVIGRGRRSADLLFFSS